MRGATPARLEVELPLRISIHAPHARSDTRNPVLPPHMRISIHAPHARSDIFSASSHRQTPDFNPRSSCEERRKRHGERRKRKQFQSTLLMRGATTELLKAGMSVEISIHAPHARSDSRIRSRATTAGNFNPRSSCEERPGRHCVWTSADDISIHAPHARSDDTCQLAVSSLCDFNPRSSCEERQRRRARGQRAL